MYTFGTLMRCTLVVFHMMKERTLFTWYSFRVLYECVSYHYHRSLLIKRVACLSVPIPPLMYRQWTIAQKRVHLACYLFKTNNLLYFAAFLVSKWRWSQQTLEELISVAADWVTVCVSWNTHTAPTESFTWKLENHWSNGCVCLVGFNTRAAFCIIHTSSQLHLLLPQYVVRCSRCILLAAWCLLPSKHITPIDSMMSLSRADPSS